MSKILVLYDSDSGQTGKMAALVSAGCSWASAHPAWEPIKSLFHRTIADLPCSGAAVRLKLVNLPDIV